MKLPGRECHRGRSHLFASCDVASLYTHSAFGMHVYEGGYHIVSRLTSMHRRRYFKTLLFFTEATDVLFDASFASETFSSITNLFTSSNVMYNDCIRQRMTEGWYTCQVAQHTSISNMDLKVSSGYCRPILASSSYYVPLLYIAIKVSVSRRRFSHSTRGVGLWSVPFVHLLTLERRNPVVHYKQVRPQARCNADGCPRRRNM
jgi:hypothetical protein